MFARLPDFLDPQVFLDRRKGGGRARRRLARPRSTASTRRGRSSAAEMIASTEPTSTARSIECTASNSAATSPSFSERTAARTVRQLRHAAGPRSTPVASATRRSSAVTRGSADVRASTSPVNTTPAAGAPPMHRRVGALDREHLHRCRSASWRRRRTPRRGSGTPRRTRSARRSSRPPGRSPRRTRAAGCRIDSGDPSKPDRFASTTSGRPPLAALIARAAFFDERGNSVPAVHVSGPSVGGKPRARHGPGLDAEQRHRVPAEVRVEDDGRLGVRHARPALQRRVVLVGDGPHQGPDVERLLALRVRAAGEDVADGAEVAVRVQCGNSRTSRSRGSDVGAGRGTASPGAT